MDSDFEGLFQPKRFCSALVGSRATGLSKTPKPPPKASDSGTGGSAGAVLVALVSLAARWHGEAAERGPGPRGGCLLQGRGRNEEAKQRLAPSPLPSQGAASRAGWGSLGGVWNTTGSLCLVLCTKNLPVQAESPQITPRGAGRWGGKRFIFSPERRNEAFSSRSLFWGVTGASAT